jgi:hypothetical protein
VGSLTCPCPRVCVCVCVCVQQPGNLALCSSTCSIIRVAASLTCSPPPRPGRANSPLTRQHTHACARESRWPTRRTLALKSFAIRWLLLVFIFLNSVEFLFEIVRIPPTVRCVASGVLYCVSDASQPTQVLDWYSAAYDGFTPGLKLVNMYYQVGHITAVHERAARCLTLLLPGSRPFPSGWRASTPSTSTSSTSPSCGSTPVPCPHTHNVVHHDA